MTFGDNGKGRIIGHGSIGNNSSSLIENVLLVDGLKHNLLSISQLCDILFSSLSYFIYYHIVILTIYYHRIAVPCFSYHVIYYMHFICIYLSYTFLFHMLFMYCTFHILSSCTLLLVLITVYTFIA